MASLKEPLVTEGFIPPHGGYQKLLSYQKAEIVYDATVYFVTALSTSAAALMIR